MGKIKSRIAVTALIAALLALLTFGTVAYYTADGVATNVITSGSIRFLIHEIGADGAPFPEAGLSVLPGQTVDKRVTFESDCTHPFYLRVKVVPAMDDDTLSAEGCYSLDINGESWDYKDGWYYYKHAVQAEEATPHLFTEVTFSGEKIDNAYVGKVMTLTVVAQAVQSENNPITGNDTSTAAGWPQE